MVSSLFSWMRAEQAICLAFDGLGKRGYEVDMASSFSFFRNRIIILMVWLGSIAVAHAHTGEGATHGVGDGFFHPMYGLDHLLAMVAVGLWSVQRTGVAGWWKLPAVFMAMMMVGWAGGVAVGPMPATETGIFLSVVVLGAFLVLALRPAWGIALACVGLFGLFHGWAHGVEMPGGASGWTYAGGFMASTALLHGCGVGVALWIGRLWHGAVLRACGALIVLVLWVGVLLA